MNKNIIRKFHTSPSGQRIRKPVTFAKENTKVYSTIPFISYERACKMIKEWGYNLEEILAYKDKQGRLFQTNFNQWQMIALKKMEFACKEIKNIKQEVVKTIFNTRPSQLHFVIGNNEIKMKSDSIHYEINDLFNSLTADKYQHNEIQRIFHSNQSLREFAY